VPRPSPNAGPPPSLAASGPAPHDWRVNVFARYFGASLIQHFPCRFQCPASRELAERVAQGLGYFETGYLDMARGLLQSPVLYTETMGVALLGGARVRQRGREIRVEPDPGNLLVTDQGSPLSRALRAAALVVGRAGEASFQVGATRFDGHLIRFT